MPRNKAFSTKIEYGDGATYQSSVTFTPFADVIEIKPPPIKADEIDTSTLESPGEFKEAEPGLADAGECTFKARYLRTQTPTIVGMFRQKKGFRIVYPDLPYPSGSKLRFTGWISGVENETLSKDGTVDAQITIRVVGAPDFGLAS